MHPWWCSTVIVLRLTLQLVQAQTRLMGSQGTVCAEDTLCISAHMASSLPQEPTLNVQSFTLQYHSGGLGPCQASSPDCTWSMCMFCALDILHISRARVWLQDVQMYEASEAATAADHEPAMGLSSSSADGTLIPQNQGVSDDVAALEPAALQEVCIKTYCRSEDPVSA